jgi:hypothetical protein
MSKSVDPNLEAIEEIPKHSFELESLKIRVSDPHWFNEDPISDPDPAFFLIADPDCGSGVRIRIQGLMT